MLREEQIAEARRGKILRLLSQDVEFDRKARLFLAEKYGCSEATIEAEIKLLRSLQGLAGMRADTNRGGSLS